MTDGKTVGEMGERELIKRLARWVQFGPAANGTMGAGDDCALLAGRDNEQIVLTTDLLIAETHFLHNPETNWAAVGQKAAGANISDLAALGAQPKALLVAVALPADFLVDDVLAIYQGIQELSSRYGAPILGGDTTRSDRVCISVTAAGTKAAGSAGCLRSDAAPGDFVYVSGDLGGSRAGLEVLLNRERSAPLHPELINELVGEHFNPVPRVKLGRRLSTIYPRIAMIDISDSLYNEANLLAEASDVELTLDLDAIPVSPGAKVFCDIHGLDPQLFALFSGEEYELLFTVATPPEELIEQLKNTDVDCLITHVGTVDRGNGVKTLRHGNPLYQQDATFSHFSETEFSL